MPIPIQDINEKVSIAGNGIVALMTAYFLFLRAKEQGRAIKISIRGKYPVAQTTAGFLVPSLSWDEIMSVVPPGKKFMDSLEKFFVEFNGGILLKDGERIIRETTEFVEAVQSCGDEDLSKKKELLVEFSKLSLSLWDLLYETADEELRHILVESNYLPCRERTTSDLALRDGYRLEFYYDVENFAEKYDSVIRESLKAGYQHVKLVEPDELIKIAPSFASFYEHYSTINGNGLRCWKSDAGVILRPGGCINTAVFLNKFTDYLRGAMGSYITEDGGVKPCFKMKLEEVTGLNYDLEKNRIVSFQIADKPPKKIKRQYQHDDFILCPGEQVGTLDHFGLSEPPYARFAGFSLKFTLPEYVVLQAGFSLDYKCNLAILAGMGSSCVVQIGKFTDSFTLGIGGLKAYLGHDEPDVNAEYAREASLYQLNMLNKIYAPLIGGCLGRDTQGKKLNHEDLDYLIRMGFVTRWAGARACTYDGVPTISYGQNKQGQIDNLIVATHLSSGGVTNCTGSAYCVDHLLEKHHENSSALSQRGFFSKVDPPRNTEQILNIMNSIRYS